MQTKNEILTVQSEELPLYEECSKKIIQHIERRLKSGAVNHHQISRFLSIRWYLTHEFTLREI